MGLNDELEKIRQAEEWLKDGTPEQKAAAADHLRHVYATSDSIKLRIESNRIWLEYLATA
jgi:hypothetical protein